MKKRVIVWKESVYKNGFRCKCGTKLVNEDGSVNDQFLVGDHTFRTYCYCKKCSSPVAYLKNMEVPEDAHGLMGNISEYERRKMN